MVGKRVVAAMALGAVGAAAQAQAQAQQAAQQAAPFKLTAAEAAAKFGARDAIQQISLSPDGTKYAALRPAQGKGMAIVVAPVDGSSPAKIIMASDGNPDQLRRCSWANDHRLICTVSTLLNLGQGPLEFSRLVAVNADGTNLKMLTAKNSSTTLGYSQGGGSVIDLYGDPSGSSILMTRAIIPERQIGTLLAEQRQGWAVERIDPDTLKRTVIEQPNEKSVGYISDGIGNVRIMLSQFSDAAGYDAPTISYSYRTPDSRSWQPLSTVEFKGGNQIGFEPVAVDPASNSAYGFDKVDGRKAVFRVALDGTGKRELVASRPDVDVDELISIGRKNRVVGVSFATDSRQPIYFDPELKKLAPALLKAMPGFQMLDFEDSSADESRLLLRVGSDNDPGEYMIFDKKTHALSPIMDARPELSGVTLATVQPITYPAADGTLVPAYLTLPPGSNGKNIPAIVMPHGGPDSRDEWGFDWLAQFFANRGYAVLQPNYRGSTGYGDDWYKQNGFKSWRTAIGDVDDAGRWMIKQGITTPDHLAIVGWSYGGYAALQSSVLDPDLFKAIVAIAPVTDFNTLRDEHRTFTDYNIVDAYIGNGPHLKEGSPAQNADHLKAPVLMFHGDKDQNVDIGESRLMKSKLTEAGKSVELVEFKELDHQLDDSDARAQMLGKADAFLRASMHLP